MSRHSASNAFWRMRRLEQGVLNPNTHPTPTPEDLACHIYTATLSNGNSTFSYPLLAANADHARELAQQRIDAEGCNDQCISVNVVAEPWEHPATMEMLLANEPYPVKEDRRLRVRQAEGVAR
jgi:hypothetical protein